MRWAPLVSGGGAESSESDSRAHRHHARFRLAQSKGYKLLGFSEIAAAQIAGDSIEVGVIGEVLGLSTDIKLAAF